MVLSGFASADKHTPCVIMIGASFADQHWPVVTNVTTGMETVDSRNNLFNGSYLGLCPLLQKALDISHTVVCSAVAGSMSSDSEMDFGPTHIKAPGYLTQLNQGLHECTSNGKLLPTSLVITLANDGFASIQSTLDAIALARSVGIKDEDIIVQAYPETMPDYARERDTALNVHGPYWGSVLQAFLMTLPTPDDYAQLIQAHRNALSNIGVNYLEFFQPDYAAREDGVHPNKKAMAYALALIKNRINNCLSDE
jgi:hypothetical protein